LKDEELNNQTTKIIQRNFPQKKFEWKGHPLLHQLYAARGVSNAGDLNLELKSLLSFQSLSNIETAVVALYEVMQAKEKLIIIGDFDADGATSTALVMEIMQAFGHSNIDFLVPNRFDFGYGLSPQIVDVAAQQKPKLLLTVDNGIANHSGVARANELGIGVVITDHHLPAETLPDAVAIVNPNLKGDEFPSKALAGVGVAFYLMSALRAHLIKNNWFEINNITQPNLANWLDLVAVGTVADMVPLDVNNRRLVAQGLKRIRLGRCRPGITSLLELAKKNPRRVSAIDIGFGIGPRLNAAGRLEDMSIGIRCLMATEEMEARKIAVELDQLNLMRREIEAGMQHEALKIVAALISEMGGGDDLISSKKLPDSLSLYHPEWHQGVVGLVASRIKEKYHRPVIAFAKENSDEDSGILKGSARSIPGIHIRDALVWVDANYPQMIQKFGGHAMAAGLSLAEKNLQEFTNALAEAVRVQLGKDDICNEIFTDGILDDKFINLETAQILADAGPWGQTFPEPEFEGEFKVIQQRIVGERHLKLVLESEQNTLIDAIAFNIDPDKWQLAAEKVHCVYKVDINEFRGETKLQFLVGNIARI
jgi:single-stranded-DNA-specific exonuclease